jgi:hypothetical protein
MDTLSEPFTFFDTQTPLGQLFLGGDDGFERPFSADFDYPLHNPLWQDSLLEDAAAFFFQRDVSWDTATEVHLRVQGERYRFASVDCVLYSLGAKGEKEKVTGYGSVIMQPISRSRDLNFARTQEWEKRLTPAALSSARAYLVNQIVFEGGMYSVWGRRMAVILETSLYDLLPTMEEVPEREADIVWLMHKSSLDESSEEYTLLRDKCVYTKYPSS